MADLRAGGLALVISGEYAGCLVVTEFFVNAASYFTAPNGLTYRAGKEASGWLCTGNVTAKPVEGTVARGCLDGFCLFAEKKLIPFGDEDFSHEKESEKQLQNA